MAIATALRGFNYLGHSVTPTFLSRAWEVEQNSRFLSTGHRILVSCDCKVRDTMVANSSLFFNEPRQLTKYT